MRWDPRPFVTSGGTRLRSRTMELGMDNVTGHNWRGVAVSAACGVLLLLVFYPLMMVGAPSDPAVAGAPDPHEELRLFIGAVVLASVASAVAVFAMLGWPVLLGKAVDR